MQMSGRFLLVLGVVSTILMPFLAHPVSGQSEWQMVNQRSSPYKFGSCQPGFGVAFWTLWKLTNENDPINDWYMLILRQQSLPGVQWCPGSTWYWQKNVNQVALNVFHGGTWITEHSPTTTLGDSSVGVSLGLSGGGGSAPGGDVGVSYSYSLPDVKIKDYSNYPLRWVEWHHVRNGGDVDRLSYIIEPGVVFKVNLSVCNSALLYFQVEFTSYGAWAGYGYIEGPIKLNPTLSNGYPC